MTQDVRHLGEMRGCEVDATGGERRAGGGGEEVGGVTQSGELAVEVAVIAQGVHLMDAHTGELLARGVERAQQQIGLTVGQRHDDITVPLSEGDDRRGVGALRGGERLLRVVHQVTLPGRVEEKVSGGGRRDQVHGDTDVIRQTPPVERIGDERG